ncbi:hypothetical protein IKG10_01855 [Candidatus Saccharibacteria bacterium]|nr:hypothetical protein [Candidatus Saccharibacteria bacterium]
MVIGTWVHVGTNQIQVVATVTTDRSRRPIVAVATSIVGGRRIEAAGIEEIIRESSYSVRSISTFCVTCVIWIGATIIVSRICSTIDSRNY